MNSSGWLRSRMAANLHEEEFLYRVADIIAREFDKDAYIIKILKDTYLFIFEDYRLTLKKDIIIDFKLPTSPYKLDKYILEELEKLGFQFDKNRSQYIKYVFNII